MDGSFCMPSPAHRQQFDANLCTRGRHHSDDMVCVATVEAVCRHLAVLVFTPLPQVRLQLLHEPYSQLNDNHFSFCDILILILCYLGGQSIVLQCLVRLCGLTVELHAELCKRWIPCRHWNVIVLIPEKLVQVIFDLWL